MSVFMQEDVIDTMDLAMFLEERVRESSYRDVAGRIGISRGALEHIIKRRAKAPPEITTLEAIANAYELKLYQVIAMTGADLGLPDGEPEEVARLMALADQIPELQPFLRDMVGMTSDERLALIAQIEVARQHIAVDRQQNVRKRLREHGATE